ncbi:hypothetical protein [Streptomyces sp. NPDC055134]
MTTVPPSREASAAYASGARSSMRRAVRRGPSVSCVVTIVAAGSAAVLWVLPSVRRLMGWGWIVPALVLGGAAAVR